MHTPCSYAGHWTSAAVGAAAIAQLFPQGSGAADECTLEEAVSAGRSFLMHSLSSANAKQRDNVMMGLASTEFRVRQPLKLYDQ